MGTLTYAFYKLGRTGLIQRFDCPQDTGENAIRWAEFTKEFMAYRADGFLAAIRVYRINGLEGWNVCGFAGTIEAEDLAQCLDTLNGPGGPETAAE